MRPPFVDCSGCCFLPNVGRITVAAVVMEDKYALSLSFYPKICHISGTNEVM